MSHAPVAVPVQGRLAGRRILVTGAASGIGRAVAGLFLQAGAQVAALDRHSPEGLPGALRSFAPMMNRVGAEISGISCTTGWPQMIW